jgi:hypothetical protein
MLRRLPRHPGSPAADPVGVRSSGLREHLLHDHGRTQEEIDGLPLAELHRFEHATEPNRLSHHPAALRTRARSRAGGA